MPNYDLLPPVLTPFSQQSQQRTIAAGLTTALGSLIPPPPPRSLIAQSGGHDYVLVTWNAPAQGNRNTGIVAWRVYLGNEDNFVGQVNEPARRYSVPLAGGVSSIVYVSGVTQQGVESSKIPIRVVGGLDIGPTPSLPPGYASEPTGGSFVQTRVP